MPMMPVFVGKRHTVTAEKIIAERYAISPDKIIDPASAVVPLPCEEQRQQKAQNILGKLP